MPDPPSTATGSPSGRRRIRRAAGTVAAVLALVAVSVFATAETADRPGSVDGAGTWSGSDSGRLDDDRAPGRPTGPATSPSPKPSSGRPPARPAAGAPVPVRVAGARLVDGRGHPVRLLGFNFSGTEFACIEGHGVFDTPDGHAPSDTVIAAMAGWGANAVRMPLNEQCWLGLPGVDPRFAGENYRSTVAGFVRRLNDAGLAVILDLHRSAPGDALSRRQEPMPDRDHSPAFWSSVAATFRGSGGVAFDLFNEPFPFEEENSTRAWTCWRDGGCTLTSVNSGEPYVAAGMTELLGRVRATGARNVVFLGGLYWAEGLAQWLRYRPVDPAGQLGASFHDYDFNAYCATTSCYDRLLGPIIAKVPLLVGEIGPDLTLGSTGIDERCPASAPTRTGFGDAAFAWFDRHGASYTAWSWNPWRDCWALVRDWHGTPTSVWGQQFRARLRAANRP